MQCEIHFQDPLSQDRSVVHIMTGSKSTLFGK